MDSGEDRATWLVADESNISKKPKPGLDDGHEIDIMTSALERANASTPQGVEEVPSTNFTTTDAEDQNDGTSTS
jgi:hypothetical protein